MVTAPSFRHPGVGPAAVFFVLSFVPLALASGIVPYTAHLLFGPSFSLEIRPPGLAGSAIALDVLRSMALGLAACLAQWSALTLPFVSLSKAYAEQGHPDAPLRAMLYRGWLLALFQLGYWVAPLGLPQGAGAFAASFVLLATVVPLLLLLYAMLATSRMGSGVGVLASLATVGVPLALMLGVGAFLERGVRAVVPELASLEASVHGPVPAPARSGQPPNREATAETARSEGENGPASAEDAPTSPTSTP